MILPDLFLTILNRWHEYVQTNTSKRILMTKNTWILKLMEEVMTGLTLHQYRYCTYRTV
jgi:hypothetical protein